VGVAAQLRHGTSQSIIRVAFGCCAALNLNRSVVCRELQPVLRASRNNEQEIAESAVPLALALEAKATDPSVSDFCDPEQREFGHSGLARLGRRLRPKITELDSLLVSPSSKGLAMPSLGMSVRCGAQRSQMHTSSVRARTLVALLVMIPSFGLCEGQPSRLEQIIEPSVISNLFMGAVLVTKDGKPLVDKGYGYANLEWRVPDSPTTKFRLGSLTKQFTAVSILLLEERGQLKTDDPVKRYLPDAPAAWDKITVFNLLTHTSGIPSFTDFPDYKTSEATPATPEQLMARFRDKPLEFQPGDRWQYSNSGYIVLGNLIEKVSGQHYADFLKKNIFEPLGMADTGYDSNESIIPRRAQGYSPDEKGPRHAGYIDMSIPFSAGALYSTTHDLLRWEEGLFGGKLLSARSLTKMTTPFKEGYAFGVFVRDEQGHKVVEHGGGIEGFNTHLAYFPDDKIAVVVLANLNDNAVAEMGRNLGIVAIGGKVVLPSERKAVNVQRATLEKYVGSYELAPTVKIRFFFDGDQLMTGAPGQPSFPVFAESETEFFLKVENSQITFVKNAKGDVTGIVLHKGGHDRPAKRVDGH